MPLGTGLKTALSPDTTLRHADRRQSPRYDMSGGVYLIEAGAEPTKVGVLRDISLGGAYVASQEDLPTGKLLTLQFKIGADFEMSGRVCRRDRNGIAVLFEPEE
jgi:PilZ domain